MQLHPEARRRIDEMASSLVGGVRQRDFPRGQADFASDRHVAVTLTDAEIIGEITPSQVDHRGVVVAKWFLHETKQYCVDGPAYVELRRVCERIAKNSPYGRVVGLDFLENLAFNWVRDTYRGGETRLFSECLAEAASAAVRPTTVWIPIAGLEIEGPFSFGPVSFRPITRPTFDRWFSQGESIVDDQQRKLFDAHVAKERGRLQGRAAVVVELVAEESFAKERALELAEIALGLLKLHSPGAISPWLTTTVAVLGSEYEPQHETVVEHNEGEFRHHQRGLTRDMQPTWRLPLAEIERKNFCLGYLSRMADERGLTEYQARVRKALLTLSKASSIADVNDRLVFLFSALEGLLLKDSSEPIQHYLGERMAFLATQNPDERMEVVGVVKRAYGLRSKYIHHQIGIDDASALEGFCRYSWVVIYTCVSNFENFPTVSDLLAKIEKAKFGG